MAIEYGRLTIVVDGFHELKMLNELAGAGSAVQDIMLRVSPSVDPHTHVHTTTGILDSKFGFSLETGHAEQAIRQAIKANNLNLVGLHFHLGSPIFELEPYAVAIDLVLTLAARLKNEGLELRKLSPGGGFPIGYVTSQPPPPIADYAEVITSTMKRRCADLGLSEPLLILEPGRAVVGRGGVAIYTVGVIKDIPTVRKYVSLDGGMGDNIRPALYESEYAVVPVDRPLAERNHTVTVAGKFCESGDVLARDVDLPEPETGELLALPASGAYCLMMASNYNMQTRPAVVLVNQGTSRLIRRRETYQDLLASSIDFD